MAWVKIDDGLPEHPKFLVLSDAAFRLWFNALAYANRRLTDGAIPRKALRRLVPDDFEGDENELAGELEAEQIDGRSPLWEANGDGWRIHDYHEYQPQRKDVLDKQAKAKERMRLNRAITRLEAAEAAGEDVADELAEARRERKMFARTGRARSQSVRAPRTRTRTRTQTPESSGERSREQVAHVQGNVAELSTVCSLLLGRDPSKSDLTRMRRWFTVGTDATEGQTVDPDRAVFVAEWLWARTLVTGERINSPTRYIEAALHPDASPQPLPGNGNENWAGGVARSLRSDRLIRDHDTRERCRAALEARPTAAVAWGIREGIVTVAE